MSTPEPVPAAPAVAPDAPDPTPAAPVVPDPVPVVPAAPDPVLDPVPAAEPVADVASQPGSTSDTGPLPAPVSVEPTAIQEVRRRAVDEEGGVQQPRTDDDAIVGQFVTIVDGPYAGRYAVYQKTVSSAPDGYPDTVLVRTRDARDESLVVDYAHLRPAAPGGR